MASESLSDLSSGQENPNKLSQNGLTVAIGVYGFLVLVGFAFGIVTGYERPKTVVVQAQPKEREKEQPQAHAETPKPQPAAGGPKLIPNTNPEPKQEPVRPDPKVVDPPKVTPKTVEPAKTEPKTPPKSAPKKEATVTISFEKQVKPILMRYCGDCHGNAGKPKGDVDLRTLASIKELKTTLVPGNPDKSRLYESITEMSMPPGGKPRPGKGETDLIREWIAGGAKPRRRKLRR